MLKNERVGSAIERIAKMELGIGLRSEPTFVGLFEHLYDDGVFDAVSTHYLNLAYEVELSAPEGLPKEQHSDYRWFALEELMRSDDVHPYVKDYFTKEKGTVPQ